MKSNLFYACAFASVISFTSCDKNNPAPVKNPQTSNSLTAKVNGADWIGIIPMATNSGGDFRLAGANMSGQTIGMYAYQANISQPGTYPVSAVYMEAPQDSSSGPTWVNPSATINITKLDTAAKKVSGTFSFTATADPSTGATGTKTITNGIFTDITLQ